MSADKGGPAFPVHPDMAGRLGCVNSESDAGMTLRDYFAAKAMQALVMPSDIVGDGFRAEAVTAYRIADAMLKERAK